jgi:hypothetical protein
MVSSKMGLKEHRHGRTVSRNGLPCGAPVPMKPPLGRGLYHAVVARGPKLPQAALYRWGVRHRLPTIPIPLRASDPDVLIDLGEAVGRVYDLGRYSRTLRYDQPLPDSVPLSPADGECVEGLRNPPAVPSPQTGR